MTTAFVVLLGTVVIRASCHSFDLEEFDGRDCMSLRWTWQAVPASRTCSKNERASFWRSMHSYSGATHGATRDCYLLLVRTRLERALESGGGVACG